MFDVVYFYNWLLIWAGIATRCGLVGPGIEFRSEGQNFLRPLRPAVGPTQPQVKWMPGHGVDHPPSPI